MARSGVPIYHNPRCGKSRATLALLRERGIEPVVVEYLRAPPDAKTLAKLLDTLQKSPRDLMRTHEPAYKDLGLDDPSLSRAALIAAVPANPILIERPIVVAGGRAVLGCPPEAVLEVLWRGLTGRIYFSLTNFAA